MRTSLLVCQQSEDARLTYLQCAALTHSYPAQVSYFNDTVYAAEQQYWSQQQADTQPRCRFTPESAQDVSAAIHEIRKFQCPFAVKSGGHASFRGASNIQDGITVDLEHLNSIDVSDDKTITHVGAGARWEDVYAKLDPLGLAVIGGRNGDIGVGGLTLGGTVSHTHKPKRCRLTDLSGGISFFSGFHGWACDNVANYEVCLARSSLHRALLTPRFLHRSSSPMVQS